MRGALHGWVVVYDRLSRLVLGLAVLGGAAPLLTELVLWLKSGRWPHETLAEALGWLGAPAPQFTWIGLQQIADATPLWIGLPALCSGALLILMTVNSLMAAMARRLAVLGRRMRIEQSKVVGA